MVTLDSCCQIDEKSRTSFISEDIVSKLPKEIRERAAKKATEITNNYVGQDLHALSILSYAAEQGRFDEFVKKLEDHYKNDFCFVAPSARRSAAVPGAVRAEKFFMQCYDSLGIKL